MLMDIFSVPQLLTMLAKSELNQKELEYQILEQIAHSSDSVLTSKLQQRSEVSIMFPYKGSTIAFVLAILSCFGVSQIKFCKSRDKVKLCKVKLDGVIISEVELRSIVNKVELIFHMAQFGDHYADTVFPSEIDELGSQAVAEHEVDKILLSEKERLLLKVLMASQKQSKKRL